MRKCSFPTANTKPCLSSGSVFRLNNNGSMVQPNKLFPLIISANSYCTCVRVYNKNPVAPRSLGPLANYSHALATITSCYVLNKNYNFKRASFKIAAVNNSPNNRKCPQLTSTTLTLVVSCTRIRKISDYLASKRTRFYFSRGRRPYWRQP